ncbi:MAG: AAA family ATPase [Desulfuromonadales bacterium]|jgi:MSHA biogenesis protein MshM|nr:AAA family ATPase [Desulfuromonadales bacterium]
MYQEHFKLREAPFSLTPDPDYFYNYTGHQQALNVLLVALQSGEGLIKITGEVGTGKTLLCRKLLAALSNDFQTAYLPNPLLKPFELYQALAEELGVNIPNGITMHDLVKRITEQLVGLRQKNKKVVLCIDEGQAMPKETLEALRLFSNLETEKHKLLQIVVFAQPELNKMLEGSDLRQLRQRITFSYDLPALDREAVSGYVNHRLKVAGHKDGRLFGTAALDAVFRASRGIPRLVNILCHKALMAAYGQGQAVVDLPQVKMACQDTEDATPLSRSLLAGKSFNLSIGVITLLEIALVVYLLRSLLS